MERYGTRSVVCARRKEKVREATGGLADLHGAFASDDPADHRGVVVVGAEALDEMVGVALWGDGHEADSHVERAEHLLLGDVPEVLEDAKDVRHGPAGAFDGRGCAFWKNPRDPSRKSATRDMCQAVGLDPRKSVHDRGCIHHRRFEERLCEGAVGAGERGIEIELVDDQCSDERESRCPQVRAVNADDHVTDLDASVVDFVAPVSYTHLTLPTILRV